MQANFSMLLIPFFCCVELILSDDGYRECFIKKSLHVNYIK